MDKKFKELFQIKVKINFAKQQKIKRKLVIFKY